MKKTKWYYLNSTSCISVNATPTLWRSRLSTFPGMEELDVSFSRACPPVIEKLTCILIVKRKGWNISVLPCQTYSCAWAYAYVSKKIWKYFRSLLLTHFSPMFLFYIPWKCQKTFGFLTFSGSLEMETWPDKSPFSLINYDRNDTTTTTINVCFIPLLN